MSESLGKRLARHDAQAAATRAAGTWEEQMLRNSVDFSGSDPAQFFGEEGANQCREFLELAKVRKIGSIGLALWTTQSRRPLTERELIDGPNLNFFDIDNAVKIPKRVSLSSMSSSSRYPIPERKKRKMREQRRLEHQEAGWHKIWKGAGYLIGEAPGNLYLCTDGKLRSERSSAYVGREGASSYVIPNRQTNSAAWGTGTLPPSTNHVWPRIGQMEHEECNLSSFRTVPLPDKLFSILTGSRP